MNSAQQPNLAAIASLLLIGGLASPVKAQFFREHPTFFEEGNRQLEREIQTLQESSPSNSVLTINSGGWQWQKFVSTEGDFRISMPDEAVKSWSWEIPTSIGILKLTAVDIEHPDYFFMAAFSQRNPSLSRVSSEALLAEVRDRLVELYGTTPTRETAIALADSPGRELTWIEDEEANQVRFYKMSDRIYIFAVGLENEMALSQTGRAFFDSFELL
ncbi:MAG: hypothetical protein J7647_14680 [Cyanobacteria bacterium SBLK]|nr:hypothetical protein [Cyanobacteria bacterium SBLK]